MQFIYGYITDVDGDKGLAKVEIKELDGIVTDWLPVIFPKTKGDKFFSMPDSGDHVAVIMDSEHLERGVILGAFYSKVDLPGDDVKGKDVTGVQFSDGNFFKYDRQTKKLTVKIETAEFIIDATGYQIKNGAETLKSVLSDLIDQLVIETHPVPGGVSGVPANAAAYSAIKVRLLTLLT